MSRVQTQTNLMGEEKMYVVNEVLGITRTKEGLSQENKFNLLFSKKRYTVL